MRAPKRWSPTNSTSILLHWPYHFNNKISPVNNVADYYRIHAKVSPRNILSTSTLKTGFRLLREIFLTKRSSCLVLLIIYWNPFWKLNCAKYKSQMHLLWWYSLPQSLFSRLSEITEINYSNYILPPISKMNNLLLISQ